MDEQELRRVAAWASSVTPKDLPSASVASARRIVFDDIGAMIAGHQDSEVQAILRDWPLMPGKATVMQPGGGAAHPWSAAEVNGLAGCWLEEDGGFRINTAHAGLYTLPTVIALAEEHGMTLGEAFTAMIVGYEVAARIVTRWDVAAVNSHSHGSVSAVAAAAAAGQALGLSEEEWLAAVTSAVTLSAAAPFDHAFRGAVVRNLWASQGNRIGQVAVHAARHGMGGLPTSIDDVYGNVFSAPRWQGAQLDDELGIAVQSAYQKMYGCCGYLHSAVEAVLELREEEEFKSDDVVGVTARMHKTGLPLNDVSPPTTLGARFSAPHAIAATLAKGSAAPKSFNAESLNDPEISRLRGAVQMVEIDRPDRDPALRDAEIEVTLSDGRTIERYVDIAIGDPARPLTEQQLIEKAKALTERDVSGLAEVLFDADLDTPFAEVSARIQELIS